MPPVLLRQSDRWRKLPETKKKCVTPYHGWIKTIRSMSGRPYHELPLSTDQEDIPSACEPPVYVQSPETSSGAQYIEHTSGSPAFPYRHSKHADGPPYQKNVRKGHREAQGSYRIVSESRQNQKAAASRDENGVYVACAFIECLAMCARCFLEGAR